MKRTGNRVRFTLAALSLMLLFVFAAESPTTAEVSRSVTKSELQTGNLLSFVDMTRAAGVWRTGIGWGVSWVDLDRDGNLDLLLPTHDLGDPILYRNLGDGTFSPLVNPIPERPYADHHVWRWVDFNRDGYPDLSNGVGSTGGRTFNFCELFLNLKNLTFKDVTDEIQLGVRKKRGRGVLWFDADQDGLLDCIVTAHLPLKMEPKYEGFRGTLFLHQTEPLKFEDLSDASSIHHQGHSYWCAPGDLEGDGDIDLFIQHHGEPPHLFRNLGSLKFEDVTQDFPFAGLTKVSDVDWVDFDYDGDLDLYISQGISGRNGTTEGFRKDGNLVDLNFTRSGESDVADEIVIYSEATTFDVRNCEEFEEVIFGRRILRPTADRYLIGPESSPAKALPVYVKQQNALVESGSVTDPDLPVEAAAIRIWYSGQEGAWHLRFLRSAERNGREYSARVVLNAPVRSVRMVDCEEQPFPNYFYENRAGQLIDVTESLGLSEANNSGDAVWQDFDNDGDLDLLLARVSFSLEGNPPLVFFRQNGNQRFDRIETGMGLDREVIQSRAGVTSADYDNDGRLDVMIGPGLSSPPDRYGHSSLFRNTSPENNWLKVQLRGTRSNTDAIGSWVYVDAGGKRQSRFHIAGQSFDGQDSPVSHFGLGSVSQIDHLTVRWPTGELQTLDNPKVNQTISIVEKE